MTTAVQVQYRRGTASQVAAFTGAAGELAVDTTNNRVVVQDGATAGGFPATKLSEVVTNTRAAVSDANYTALATDRTIAFTAITAARTVTLPAAASYPTGTRLLIMDESGSCSAANAITVAAAGSDTIGGAASAIIPVAYGYLALESNGASKWTVIDIAVFNGTAPIFAPHGSNIQCAVLEDLITCSGASSVSTRRLPGRLRSMSTPRPMRAAAPAASSAQVSASPQVRITQA